MRPYLRGRHPWQLMGIFALLSLLGCASLRPVEILPDQELYKRIDALTRNPITFVSFGTLRIRGLNLSEELDISAVVRMSPFALRMEVYKRKIVPLMTIVVQDEDWTIIDFTQRVAYLGKGSCERETKIFGVTLARGDLVSILYGRPVFVGPKDFDKGPLPNSLLVSKKGGCERLLIIEKELLRMKDPNPEANYSILFFTKGEIDWPGNLVRLEMDNLGPQFEFNLEELREGIETGQEIFSEMIPPNFVLKTLDDLK